jgi:hypothetical protein
VNSFLTIAVDIAANKPPDEKVAPGLLGFAVVAAIGLAVWFLAKSMAKHMRKVDFTETEAGAEPKAEPEAAPASAKSAAGSSA